MQPPLCGVTFFKESNPQQKLHICQIIWQEIRNAFKDMMPIINFIEIRSAIPEPKHADRKHNQSHVHSFRAHHAKSAQLRTISTEICRTHVQPREMCALIAAIMNSAHNPLGRGAI
jgi:hypothetical protein